MGSYFGWSPKGDPYFGWRRKGVVPGEDAFGAGV